MNDNIKRFYNVLKILEGHNLNRELILVGGWCLELYKYHFDDSTFPVVQTQDIDILIKNPFPPVTTDIDLILTENGFLKDYSPEGHIHYINEELEIEFLTPAKGRGTDKPVKVKRFNITAQALRFMDIIQKYTEVFSFHKINVLAPNPCAFALVKILVSNRRQGSFLIKAEKDRETAMGILEYLHNNQPEKLKDIVTIRADFSRKLIKEILEAVKNFDSKLYLHTERLLLD
jgi:hypothetical protein